MGEEGGVVVDVKKALEIVKGPVLFGGPVVVQHEG